MFIVFLSMFGCGDNDCSPFLEVTTVSGRYAIDKNEIRTVSEESDKKGAFILTRSLGSYINTENSYDDITHQLSCTK